jgi:hypothetical protein
MIYPTANQDKFTISKSQMALTFGVNPLKKAIGPSSLSRSFTTTKPDTFRSKFAFCMRVLIVSNGSAIVIDATAPAMEAMKF